MPKVIYEAHFQIPGEPVAAPRMTRADKWKERPCVLRYRTWRDVARLHSPKNLPKKPERVEVNIYISMPSSWPEKKKRAMKGQPHRSKPDIDNLIKATLDALWPEDSCVYRVLGRKQWDDGKGPRVVVFVEGE